MSDVKDATLLDMLEKACALAPANDAVIAQDMTLNFGQLLEQSKKLGYVLAGLTDKPVVALFLPMHPAFVSTFFGTLYAGKCVLPLNMLLPGEDLAFIMQDAGADTIVTIPLFKKKLEALPFKVVSLDELGPPEKPVAPKRPELEDLCTLLYTSGTTGQPKGVELTHRNLASNVAACIEMMQFSPEYRVLACLPTFHTFAITATMLAPLLAGGSMACVPRFDPEAVLKVAAETQSNTLVMVPSMFRVVTKMQQRKQYPLKIKLAVAGGEAMPSDVGDSFQETFGIPLLQGYGQTEASPVVSFNTVAQNKPASIGRPLPGVDVRIADQESGEMRGKNEIGEIQVKGPNVMRGYHNRPDTTAAVLTEDGWLRTGDMGKLDDDGFIVITGRLREMIKVAGEMVFPAEVENALLKHPAVHEAGVVGEKDQRRGETVKAFVALNEGAQATADELSAHCRAHLAPYMVPRAIEFRDELPKGPTGKVMRRLLK